MSSHLRFNSSPILDHGGSVLSASCSAAQYLHRGTCGGFCTIWPQAPVNTGGNNHPQLAPIAPSEIMSPLL